jgi:cell division protein FtsB
MAFWRETKRRAKAALLPLLFAAVCGYFAWHAVHGERGLQAREQRQQQLVAARAELARAEAERDGLERRVAGLRGGEIDRDQLDERARVLLNLLGRDEIAVPYAPERRLY